MQRDALEAVVVGGFGGNRYLFDGARVVVTAAGTHQHNLRRVRLTGLNEKILADANRLARLNASDVVEAIVIHLHSAAIDVILTTRQLDPLSAVELNLAVLKRAVRRDLEFGRSAGDGA